MSGLGHFVGGIVRKGISRGETVLVGELSMVNCPGGRGGNLLVTQQTVTRVRAFGLADPDNNFFNDQLLMYRWFWLNLE